MEQDIPIYLALRFSLESPPGLEKGNVCFIFVQPDRSLGPGDFLWLSDSTSLNIVGFFP